MRDRNEQTRQRLADRQAQRQAYINKANETQIKIARVEEEIKKLKGQS